LRERGGERQRGGGGDDRGARPETTSHDSLLDDQNHTPAQAAGQSRKKINAAPAGDDAGLVRATHRAVRDVTADIEGFAFNKAIARLYELTGAIGRAPSGAPARRAALKVLAQLIAPMTPHLAEDVWAALGGEGLVTAAPWPEAD